MEDRTILADIEHLVDEEQKLFHRSTEAGLGDGERERLHALQIRLDQCWDLLRRRRALREAGQDPNAAADVRPAEVVE
ncbi:MAG: DUF2630 family protein, partial [Chloroflexi bacterium]|nr:DUF2630 family protein [Chloroflexota bacterium]